MSFRTYFAIAFFAIGLALPAAAQEPVVVQPFAGSELARPQYAVDFDVLGYFTALDGDVAETAEIEGQLRSGLYSWPEGKAPIEIERSFETALDAAGFDILVDTGLPEFSDEQSAIKALQDTNRIGQRGFSIAGQQVTVFPGHYISAKRTEAGQTTVFTLTISSNRRIYMTEEITTAGMEEGTVDVSAKALTAEIEEAGKAILYGVQFDTGSAVIRPSSAASLEAIAEVLTQRNGRFYVVGHTDDTGGFELNMTLSANRAAAIVSALVQDYGIGAGRLQAGGVGPLAPLASNENEAGRQLNRRVELVEMLAE